MMTNRESAGPSSRPASGGACSGFRPPGVQQGAPGLPGGLHRLGAPGQTLVPIRQPFVDDRGEIRNLIDVPFASAAVITSVKGAIRANHYHKTDYHYCWLQRGGLIYFQRQVGSTEPPQRWVIRPGDMFYTPAMHEHAMYFTEESVLFAFARNHRDMDHYEADTVRVRNIGSWDPE